MSLVLKNATLVGVTSFGNAFQSGLSIPYQFHDGIDSSPRVLNSVNNGEGLGLQIVRVTREAERRSIKLLEESGNLEQKL